MSRSIDEYIIKRGQTIKARATLLSFVSQSLNRCRIPQKFHVRVQDRFGRSEKLSLFERHLLGSSVLVEKVQFMELSIEMDRRHW